MGTIFTTLVATVATSAVTITVNLGVSSFLEWIFPPFDPSANVFLGFLEAIGECTLYILFAGVVSRSIVDPLSPYLPARVAFSSLLFLYFLDNANAKLRALTARFLSPNGGSALGAKLSDPDADGPEPTDE